ncbi:hypothetical protein PHLCEN_2v9659 [Hermanssonia centrifuga]|uniref:Uncharacterized protein n=1 Tax=Hermanssonia centrifuga TaxID=98765 RepID=A0A2R6NQ76_9APHY|nr:hypothetical protein PHLCEN_2v9659 [Hermanssonia centrifuga]
MPLPGEGIASPLARGTLGKACSRPFRLPGKAAPALFTGEGEAAAGGWLGVGLVWLRVGWLGKGLILKTHSSEAAKQRRIV